MSRGIPTRRESAVEAEQLPLFGVHGDREALLQGSILTTDSCLAVAVERFHDHMLVQAYSQNTIRAFLSDLSIAFRFLGWERSVGSVSTQDLEEFLVYLRRYRGKPCSPKSLARRITTLKALFSWLVDAEVIPQDPAAPIAQEQVRSPLPLVLYTDQVSLLLTITHRMMFDSDRPDPRPHLLVSLLLKTGIKKGEAMRIRLADLDLADPQGAVVYIRYANPRQRHKERKLSLPVDFAPTLTRYRERYQPRELLFECTARNLEYTLRNLAQRADLAQGVSFEMLRWTSAVQDYRSGMRPEALRQKLGLSEITWHDVLRKLRTLGGPAL
jgi:site-specific recombinase XerD